MHTVDHPTRGATLVFAATDLSNFLGCPAASLLDRAVAFGAPKPPVFEDPGLEVLQERGLEHEAVVLQRLRAGNGGGAAVVTIDDPGPGTAVFERWNRGAEATLQAMRSGAEVIYQAVLFDGRWLGRPDFLVRSRSGRSDLGAWSYEVVDAKLSGEAKGGAVLQICLYSDLLAHAQGAPPEKMHLALGGSERPFEVFRVAHYAAYYRSVRAAFESMMADRDLTAGSAPEPVERCGICRWQLRCDRGRREADHLSLVAGIASRQRSALVERGVGTLAALAGLSLPMAEPLEGVGAAALERVRDQARIQLRGREAGEWLYELLDPEPGQGLLALPHPSEGDLFLDFEGDPHALDGGLEYLVGWTDAEGRYTADWALDRASEKRAFERFIDLVHERLRSWPDLHVYHFAPYETGALKRLMGRHATRIDELDWLLRGERFVDLYRVVRQGLRASVESYSIKKLEPLYGFTREEELRGATHAIQHFHAWLQLGQRGESDARLLGAIERYNRDDCVSTLALRAWLEERRNELERNQGTAFERRPAKDGAAPDEQQEVLDRVAELAGRLSAGLPEDLAEHSDDQAARMLLSHLLDFHRREKKSVWWQFFAWCDMSEEELLEDREAVAGLVYEGVVGEVKRSEIHRYRFPSQDHQVKEGESPTDPSTGKGAGTVVRLEDSARTIDLKRGKSSDAPHPTALLPFDDIRHETLRDSLLRLAESVLESGFVEDGRHAASADILLRRAPRVDGDRGSTLRGEGEDLLDAAKRLGLTLTDSVLPIQGPPGAGKTYTGARMILALLGEGKRVGVTATSHKVIANLLDGVCEAAREEAYPVEGIQKASGDQACAADEIEAAGTNDKVRAALENGDVRLAAGTSWLWSREDMRDSVDVLFIDEAGQFSLANALAVAGAARSVVLLGDPRQLQQPQRGVHPPGADVSVLDHLLEGAVTMPAERGLFLDQTWRLHPDVCAFTSELFYDGRLSSRPGLDRQRFHGPEPLNGRGLRFVPVDHRGRQSESPEEVGVVLGLVRMVEDGRVDWTDREGETRPLTAADVLVVAPYNAQVSLLANALPTGTKVGTVDRFQGQEAPLVLYSMASSSAADAPRGMDFLYNANRLNVATSRARGLVVVVGSPNILEPACRTPGQMKLANAFCRFREMARKSAAGLPP